MKKTILTSISILLLFVGTPLFAEGEKLSQAETVTQLTVNINEASAEQLAEVLSGVGEAKANAIVEYRAKHGSFNSLDELAEVKGIGTSVLAKNSSKIEL